VKEPEELFLYIFFVFKIFRVENLKIKISDFNFILKLFSDFFFISQDPFLLLTNTQKQN